MNKLFMRYNNLISAFFIAVIVIGTGYSPMNAGMAERAAKVDAMKNGAIKMQKNNVKANKIINKTVVKENGKYKCIIEMEVN